MRRGVGVVCGLGLLAIGATNAFAQAGGEPTRGFVNVNVVGQTGSEGISKTLTFELYDEVASISVAHKTGGVLFDLTGGMVVRGPLSVGVNVNRRSSTTDGTLNGQIPDPIRYDNPRSVSGTVADMAHQEVWFAALLFYDVPLSAGPITDKIKIKAFLGPAVAKVTDDLVQSVSVTEPNDTPVVTTSVASASRAFLGAQLGVDIAHAVTDRLGIGALVRYQRASGTLPGNVKVKAGGFQIGAGLRYTF